MYIVPFVLLLLALLIFFFVRPRVIDGYISPAPMDGVKKLEEIHKKLQIQFGNKTDEYPEQLLAVKYIQPHHCVLELGGNIGRSSCVIGSILEDSSNLVVFESSPVHAQELMTNRDTNGLKFHIEPRALSNVPLIQKDWVTTTWNYSEAVPKDWAIVDTVDYTTFRKRYRTHKFDVLVADCEGALYNILQDMPELIDSIQIVQLENDFGDIAKGQWVHQFLRDHGFTVVESIPGGWGHFKDEFFQVWKK